MHKDHLIARLGTPRQVVLFFVAANFLFLVLDILIAHSYNRFASTIEWMPVGYCGLLGLLLLLYGIYKNPAKWLKLIVHIALWAAAIVGALGFYYHFHGATFQEFSLKSLVYAAPLVAPLALTGLALVALFSDNLLRPFGEIRRRLLFFLVGGGFAGNLFLSILDHARNGFFDKTEWIPVFVAAFATIVFIWASIKTHLSREDVLAIHIAIIATMVTGIIGFIFHLVADLHGIMPAWQDNFIYGAPIFAPLLFCDVAVLGFLAILMEENFEGWTSSHWEGKEWIRHASEK